MFTGVAYADDCKWDDNIPCVTIYPKYTNNSNALGDKITPTKTIKKSEIDKYNLSTFYDDALGNNLASWEIKMIQVM